MSGIFFGLFKCIGKNHTMSKKGKETFRVKFEDDQGNRITVLVDESTFDAFREDDPLPWRLVKHQRTLEEATP